MSETCLNINLPESKSLISKYGYTTANYLFQLNNDTIPTEQDIQRIIGEKRVTPVKTEVKPLQEGEVKNLKFLNYNIAQTKEIIDSFAISYFRALRSFGPTALINEIPEELNSKIYNIALNDFLTLNGRLNSKTDSSKFGAIIKQREDLNQNVLDNFHTFIHDIFSVYMDSFKAKIELEDKEEESVSGKSKTDWEEDDVRNQLEQTSAAIRKLFAGVFKYKEITRNNKRRGTIESRYFHTFVPAGYNDLIRTALNEIRNIPPHYDVILNKLKELGQKKPEFLAVVQILEEYENAYKDDKKSIQYANLQLLKTLMVEYFTKNKGNYDTKLFDPEDNTLSSYSSSGDKLEDGLVDRWKGNYMEINNSLEVNKSITRLAKDYLEKAKKTSGLDRIENLRLAYAKMGIYLDDYLLTQSYLDFTTNKEISLSEMLSSWIDDIEKEKPTDIFDKTQKGAVKLLNIAKNIASKSIKDSDFQHATTDGNQKYEVQNYTNFSFKIAMINYAIEQAEEELGFNPSKKQSNDLQALIYSGVDISSFEKKVRENLMMYCPEVLNVFSTGSRLLNEVILTGKKLRHNIYEQIKNKDSGDGAVFSDMETYDREIVKLDDVLEAKYHARRSADRSVEYGLQIENFGEFSGGKDLHIETPDKFADVMIEYLKSEIALMNQYNQSDLFKRVSNFTKNTNGGEPIIFKGILTPHLRKDILDKILLLPKQPIENATYFFEDTTIRPLVIQAFKDFLTIETRKTQSYFEKLGIGVVGSSEEETGEAVLTGISSNLYKGTPLLEDARHQIFMKYFANNFAMSIEQDMVFFGHQAFYKNPNDVDKRLTLFHSTVERLRTDDELMGWMNEVYPRPGKSTIEERRTFKKIVSVDKVVKTSEKQLNEWADAVRERCKRDGMSESDTEKFIETHVIQPYKEVKITDGTAKSSIGWYRDLLLMGKRADAKALKIIQHEIDFLEGKVNTPLNQEDTNYILNVLKLLAIGPIHELMTDRQESNVYAPYAEKKADDPLLPSAIYQDPELWALAKYMHQMGIDELQFSPKVGTILTESGQEPTIFKDNGEMIELFDKKGKPFQTLPTASIQSIGANYLGFSQETGSETKDVTPNGVQVRMNLWSNHFDNGIPVDYTGNNWNDLEESQKEEYSEIYKEFRRFNQLLTESILRPFQDSLEKLGFRPNKDGTYSQKSRKAFVELLKHTALKSGVDINIISGIEALSDANITMDFLTNYEQVSAMLFAYLKKNSVKEKRFGGAKIQTSEFGLKRPLLFYQKSKRTGETLPCEVKIGIPKDWISYVESVGGLEEFNKMVIESNRLFREYHENSDSEIPDYPIDINLLTGVGFRIPNQQFSSSDYFIVPEFLPYIVGEAGIVPGQLLKKGNSDLDVDKLNVYLNNYIIDSATDKPFYIHPQNKDEQDYIIYVQALTNRNDELVKRIKQNQWEEFNDLVDEEREKLMDDINESLTKQLDVDLPDATSEDLITNHKLIKVELLNVGDKELIKLFQNTKGIKRYLDLSEKLNDKIKSAEYKKQRKIYTNIQNLCNKNLEILGLREETKKEYDEFIKNTKREFKENIKSQEPEIKFRIYSMIAEQFGLMSFDQYKNNLDVSYMSDQAIQNELTQLQINRLKDKNFFADLITPVTDDTLIKEVANSVKQTTGTTLPYQLYTPVHNAEATEAFLVGKSLVATSANQSKSHNVAQVAGLYVNNWGFPSLNTYNANTQKIGNREVITFGGIKGNSGDRISERISDFLTAFVDVAKDPYIFQIANAKSLDTVMYLLRSGANPTWLGKFVASPIIQKYLREVSAQSSVTKDFVKYKDIIMNLLDVDEELYDGLLSTMLLKWDKERENLTREERDELIQKITRKTEELNKIKYTESQLQDIIEKGDMNKTILEQFLEYARNAGKLGSASINMRPDSSSFKNPNELNQHQNKVAEMMNDAYFGNQNEMMNGILKPYQEVYNLIMNDLVPNVYMTFHPNYATELAEIKDKLINANKGTKASKIAAKVDRRFILFLYQNISPIFNVDKTKLLMVKSKSKDEKNLPQIIQEIQRNPEHILNQNPLIRQLVPLLDKDAVDNLRLFSRRMTTYDKDIINIAFREIYQVDKNLFMKLMGFIMTQGGLEISNISLSQYIPNDILYNYVKTIYRLAKSQSLDFNNEGVFWERLQLVSPELNPKIGKHYDYDYGAFVPNTYYRMNSKQAIFDYLVQNVKEGDRWMINWWKSEGTFEHPKMGEVKRYGVLSDEKGNPVRKILSLGSRYINMTLPENRRNILFAKTSTQKENVEVITNDETPDGSLPSILPLQSVIQPIKQESKTLTEGERNTFFGASEEIADIPFENMADELKFQLFFKEELIKNPELDAQEAREYFKKCKQ